MQIQNSLLRIQVNRLCKQNAFLKIKTKMLQQYRLPSQVTIVNKQLYLQYMEEVLSHKEKQLIKTERRLEQKQLQIIQQQSQIKLLNPLNNSTQIDLFLKKLEEIKAFQLTDPSDGSSFDLSEWKEFMKRESQIIEQCRNYQRQTENLIKNQYQKLIIQRRQLAQSMDKFEELHSYEKYLNQLQKILQAKETEVLKKQDELHTIQKAQVYQTQRGGLSFGGDNRQTRQMCDRKRLKYLLIQSKNLLISQQITKPPNQFSNMKAIIKLSLQKNMLMQNQSSYIMQQSQNHQEEHAKHYFTNSQKQEEIKYTESVETQTNIETIKECFDRLEKEKKLLKFAQLWLKHSINSKKTTSVILRKTFGFYLWKLNTVHDPSLPEHLKQNFEWPKTYQQTLKNQQLFPYKELSLNRKKYSELTLDLQRKLLHRNKIKNALKHIIRNKVVKERLIFTCYFKRCLQNAKLKSIFDYQKAISTSNKFSGKNTTVMEPNSRYNTESRLVSVNSSRIMNEQKSPNELLKDTKGRSKVQLNSKSMSSTNLFNFTQQKVLKGAKENISPTDSLDAKKLKQYIRTHQEAQKALATQCVKTEAICKLGQTLIGCLNKHLIYSFYLIKQNEEQERVIELERKINKYEFKWEMFMTKCKLALVNNNNKINHLQDTLGFMFGK